MQGIQVIFVLIFTLMCSANGARWSAHFETESLQVEMNSVREVNLTISEIEMSTGSFHLVSEHPYLASVDRVIQAEEINSTTRQWTGSFKIFFHFLGNTRIFVEQRRGNDSAMERSENFLDLIIVRDVRLIDHLFTASVGLLVSILYINFGAALDLSTLKELITRPVGPAIGFCGQFIIMPLVSFALGYVLFPDMMEIRLGLFFTGVSPGGGSSNIFTVLLNGNLNLSIAMTTISNIAALGMMPLWIFTLGAAIFQGRRFAVPYGRIGGFSAALIIPLSIGIGIQKFCPKLAKVLVRLLKPISTGLILFMICFAISTNLYLFKLFSYKIIIAGMGLPWLGYLFSWIVAKLLKQSPSDALTIAIETGIQNTGIAIFLLRFSLDQPQADLTTVIPVACAMMTPIPLFILIIVRKLCGKAKEDNSVTEKEKMAYEAVNIRCVE